MPGLPIDAPGGVPIAVGLSIEDPLIDADGCCAFWANSRTLTNITVNVTETLRKRNKEDLEAAGIITKCRMPANRTAREIYTRPIVEAIVKIVNARSRR
jgi:hypothetical protein